MKYVAIELAFNELNELLIRRNSGTEMPFPQTSHDKEVELMELYLTKKFKSWYVTRVGNICYLHFYWKEAIDRTECTLLFIISEELFRFLTINTKKIGRKHVPIDGKR